MFEIFTRRFRNPRSHLAALIERVSEDVSRRSARLSPPADEESQRLLELSRELVAQLLGPTDPELGPAIDLNLKALSENEIASCIHHCFCTCIVLLEHDHPSHAKRLADSLGRSFAGTGNPSAPWERAQMANNRGGHQHVMGALRDALVRILLSAGLKSDRSRTALGVRFNRVTGTLSTRLRRLFRGSEQFTR